MSEQPAPDIDELRRQAGEFAWYHSIDLGGGVVTKGLSESASLQPSQTPPLEGKRVLDIGAWDGYYSFLAERAGASEVVALDHYAWGVDIGKRNAYWEECRQKGVLPDHERDVVDFWDPALPGRRGFDLARKVLNSKVEAVVGDIMTIDPAELGTFDVVFFLGVLYHMKEPLGCLEQVRALTRGVAVVETEAVHIKGLDHESFMQFRAGGELRQDYGNWYVPSIEGLRHWCRAAGFAKVTTIVPPPPPKAEHELGPKQRYLRKFGLGDPMAHSQPSVNYRAVVHAFAEA